MICDCGTYKHFAPTEFTFAINLTLSINIY